MVQVLPVRRFLVLLSIKSLFYFFLNPGSFPGFFMLCIGGLWLKSGFVFSLNGAVIVPELFYFWG